MSSSQTRMNVTFGHVTIPYTLIAYDPEDMNKPPVITTSSFHVDVTEDQIRSSIITGIPIPLLDGHYSVTVDKDELFTTKGKSKDRK